MRSVAQIARTPRQYAALRRERSSLALGELLALLDEARSSGAEWYRWIRDGRPELTSDEYAALASPRTRR